MVDSISQRETKSKNTWPQKVLRCIEDAENGVLEDAPNAVLTGFAGDRLTGLIQRLSRLVGKDYLEIGVFQGSSLLNTAYVNRDIHCYGIDNFSEFDPGGKNMSIVQKHAKQLNIENYSLIDKDFEIALQEFNAEIGVYFVDGPHDYRSQFLCLAYAVRFLARQGVMIIDDANYPHVRQATADFLKLYPEFKLIFQAYTKCHPININKPSKSEARKGWWDGVNVILHDPDDQFVGLKCPVTSNVRFIRDHYVHGLRLAPVAAEGLLILQALTKPWQLPKATVRYLMAVRSRRDEIRARVDICETESQNLKTETSKLNDDR